MPTHKSYHSYLIESLKDPAEAAAYLDAVLEDDDFEHLLLALKNVAEARRSCTEIASESSFDWEHCYQFLNEGETQGLFVVSELLKNLGLKLAVTVKNEPAV